MKAEILIKHLKSTKDFISAIPTYLKIAFCGICGKLSCKLPSMMSGNNRQRGDWIEVLNKRQLLQSNLFSIITTF